ncbi:PIN domain-containing protein [Bacillus thuringiensis]|uniref:PIN domain-containing protein n=1 Tax=Bacillus thuringiensis TaxID=1428 RepID=UPI000CD7FC0D|nr:PIN domain-containing protein [Bacillus thuringiensis]QFQ28621.1 hypothetical protein DDE73_28580 [Bacillus thuringiensis]
MTITTYNLYEYKDYWNDFEIREYLEFLDLFKARLKFYCDCGFYIGLDTNLIMDFPVILDLIKSKDKLLISRKVYDELDGLKKTSNKAGKQARYALQKLEEYQISNGPISFLKTDKTFTESLNLQPESPDDLIIASYIKEKNQNDKKVLFLSNDRGARILSRSVNLDNFELSEDLIIPCDEEGLVLIEYEHFLEFFEQDKSGGNYSSIENNPYYYQQFKNFYLYHREYRRFTDENGKLNPLDLLNSTLSPFHIERKKNAETFGYQFIKNYGENEQRSYDTAFNTIYTPKLPFETEYKYDHSFLKGIDWLKRAKKFLHKQGGLSFIPTIMTFKHTFIQAIQEHHEKGGYFCIDETIYKRFPIILKLIPDMSNLLIDESTYHSLQKDPIYMTLKYCVEKEIITFPFSLESTNISNEFGEDTKKQITEELILSTLSYHYRQKDILVLSSNVKLRNIARSFQFQVYEPPSEKIFCKPMQLLFQATKEQLMCLYYTDL